MNSDFGAVTPDARSFAVSRRNLLALSGGGAALD